MTEIYRVDAENFDRHAELLALLQEAFSFMQGRIDPPSSLNKLDEEKLARKSREEILFIATDNNRLVGCAFACPREDYMYLGKLAVKPDCQGQGLSRLLITQVEACARDLALSEVEIETRVELVENQTLFKHFGYRKTAENSHPGYHRPTSFCYRKKVSQS